MSRSKSPVESPPPPLPSPSLTRRSASPTTKSSAAEAFDVALGDLQMPKHQPDSAAACLAKAARDTARQLPSSSIMVPPQQAKELVECGELHPVRSEQRGREGATEREHVHEGERDAHEVDRGVPDGFEQRRHARDAPPLAIEGGSAARAPPLEERERHPEERLPAAQAHGRRSPLSPAGASSREEIPMSRSKSPVKRPPLSSPSPPPPRSPSPSLPRSPSPTKKSSARDEFASVHAQELDEPSCWRVPRHQPESPPLSPLLRRPPSPPMRSSAREEHPPDAAAARLAKAARDTARQLPSSSRATVRPSSSIKAPPQGKGLAGPRQVGTTRKAAQPPRRSVPPAAPEVPPAAPEVPSVHGHGPHGPTAAQRKLVPQAVALLTDEEPCALFYDLDQLRATLGSISAAFPPTATHALRRSNHLPQHPLPCQHPGRPLRWHIAHRACTRSRTQPLLLRHAIAMKANPLAACLVIARDLGMGCEVRATCSLSTPPSSSAADSHSASWTLPSPVQECQGRCARCAALAPPAFCACGRGRCRRRGRCGRGRCSRGGLSAAPSYATILRRSGGFSCRARARAAPRLPSRADRLRLASQDAARPAPCPRRGGVDADPYP